MADKNWKRCEREIAKFFPGAKRRGANFGDKDGGKSDLIMPGWSVEIKNSSRPTFSLMVSAVAQAERSREHPDDIPVAVIHKVGTPYKDSLVILRMEPFQDFVINLITQDKENEIDDQ